MQLSEAIDGWLAAHSAGLSTSTRRDITDIAASADRRGFGWMDCIDVRDKHIGQIVAEADAGSSLNAQAIRQFLEITVEWALTQTEAPTSTPSNAPRGGAFQGAALETSPVPVPSQAPSADKPLPSDTDSWVGSRVSPVVDDLNEISWVDDLPPVDDLDVDKDGELDPLDDDQFFEVDDIGAATQPPVEEAEAAGDASTSAPQDDASELIDEDDFDDDELDLIDADLTAVDEDELGDDELALIDQDLATTDEDDLDDHELDLIDSDLASLVEASDELDGPFQSASDLAGPDDDLFEPDLFDTDLFDADLLDDDLFDADAPASGSAFSVAAGRPADPAASSFLRTLEETGQTPVVFGDLAPEPALANASAEIPAIDTGPSGIFSEAAQYDGERSVDWVTVAYFAVAAICFALVIYFYLSS